MQLLELEFVNRFSMTKNLMFIFGLILLSSCQSDSRQIVFPEKTLLDGEISISSSFNLNYDKTRMDGEVFVNISKIQSQNIGCKIEAKILPFEMNHERSNLQCNTLDNSCFLNFGDFRENPRMVLYLTDATVSKIDLEVLIENSSNNSESCLPKKYGIEMDPKPKNVSIFQKAFSR